MGLTGNWRVDKTTLKLEENKIKGWRREIEIQNSFAEFLEPNILKMTVLIVCPIGNAKVYTIFPYNLVSVLDLRVNSLEMFLNEKVLVLVLIIKEE